MKCSVRSLRSPYLDPDLLCAHIYSSKFEDFRQQWSLPKKKAAEAECQYERLGLLGTEMTYMTATVLFSLDDNEVIVIYTPPLAGMKHRLIADIYNVTTGILRCSLLLPPNSDLLPGACVVSYYWGKFIVTGSQNGTLALWESANGEYVSRIQGHEGKVCQLVSTQTDEMLSVGEEGVVRVWKILDFFRLVESD